MNRHFRMPFDWRTPLGYLIVLALESFVVSSIGFTNMPLICFIVGSCWLINSLVKDIANDLIDFNVSKKNEVRMKAKENLCHIVQNFADIKQLSENSNMRITKIVSKNSKTITILFYIQTYQHG